MTFSRKPKPSGIYTSNTTNFCGTRLEAKFYCDTSTDDGGGYLVIQRRKDGSVDFNRTWVEYENGFGELTGEFWYGLKALRCLTSSRYEWEVRMDFQLANGSKFYFIYLNFRVTGYRYKLSISNSYYGFFLTNPMDYHNNMYFTTKDFDNDNSRHYSNCA